MSFLYPRTIRITRPQGDGVAAEGLVPYGGLDREAEDAVPGCSAIRCSIQHSTSSGRPAAGVPSDAVSATVWDIYIPRRFAPPPGAIRTRDVVTDDLGNRYQVTADYSHPMGWTLRTERLEA